MLHVVHWAKAKHGGQEGGRQSTAVMRAVDVSEAVQHCELRSLWTKL